MEEKSLRPYVGSFAIESVYRKLTTPLDGLSAEDTVEGLLHGANQLKQGIAQVIERFFVAAEEKQRVVMEERAGEYRESLRLADAAAAQGKVDEYDAALQGSIEACLRARESVAKMRFVQTRGFGAYDQKKALANIVSDVERLVQTPKKLLGGK